MGKRKRRKTKDKLNARAKEKLKGLEAINMELARQRKPSSKALKRMKSKAAESRKWVMKSVLLNIQADNRRQTEFLRRLLH